MRFIMNRFNRLSAARLAACLAIGIAAPALVGCYDWGSLSAGSVKDADVDGLVVDAPTDGGVLGGDIAQPQPDLALAADLLPCVDTLADIGASDFTISFIIRTSDTSGNYGTVLYQRDVCDDSHDWWDLQLTPLGTLAFYANKAGASESEVLASDAAVNDGKPHNVIYRRRSSILTVTIDGSASGSAVFSLQFKDLSILGVAVGNPCERPPTGNMNQKLPLIGDVSAVCITTS